MPISFYATEEEREAVEIEIEDTVAYLMEQDGERFQAATHEALISLCQTLSDKLYEKTQKLASSSPVVQLFEALSRIGSYVDLYVMAVAFVMLASGGLLKLPTLRTIVTVVILVHMAVLAATVIMLMFRSARKLKMYNIIAMLRILRDEYAISSDDAQFTDEMACRVIAATNFKVTDENSSDDNDKGDLYEIPKEENENSGETAENTHDDENHPDDSGT